jgi:hypothetical protein
MTDLTPAEQAAAEAMGALCVPPGDIEEVAPAVIAAVRNIIAEETLRTERKTILDHKAKLLADRTRLGQRFEGRLQGLEEAAGKLTSAIKAIRKTGAQS